MVLLFLIIYFFSRFLLLVGFLFLSFLKLHNSFVASRKREDGLKRISSSIATKKFQKVGGPLMKSYRDSSILDFIDQLSETSISKR